MAEAKALKYGNRVDRQEYGSIEVSRKDVNSALNYLQSDGEIAAFAALPHVLKRGKEIYREADHKGRGYSTVTFAGLVEINDTRGNMAVVVRETSKNHYDMHRIVMPDGSAFTFAEKQTQKPDRLRPHPVRTRSHSPRLLRLKSLYPPMARMSSSSFR